MKNGARAGGDQVFRTWGGKRKGAGRKPRAGKKRVSHTARPELPSRFPTHITLRFVDGLPTMRRRDAYRAIRQAMYVVMPRTNFRVVHLSMVDSIGQRNASSNTSAGVLN